jgi:hypothetical protein
MRLKDKIMMITGLEEKPLKSGSFRLKDGIEINRGLLGLNESYRPTDNLLESRVLSNIPSISKRN